MGDEGAIRQIIGGAIEHEDPASLLTNLPGRPLTTDLNHV